MKTERDRTVQVLFFPSIKKKNRTQKNLMGAAGVPSLPLSGGNINFPPPPIPHLWMSSNITMMSRSSQFV